MITSFVQRSFESPSFTLSQAADLFNQQIWCWGRDIECAEGNLLTQYGFQRIERPAGSPSASIYRLELPSSARIILRGFGVFYGDDRWGGLFVRRFNFKPQLTPQPDLSDSVWLQDDLPPLSDVTSDQVPYCEHLLLDLIDWIRNYEVWIAEQFGIAYRIQTLLDWKAKHGSIVLAEEMAVAWRLLALSLLDDPERFILTKNPKKRKRVRRRTERRT